jgi:integrase
MSPGKEPASILAEACCWPVDVTRYDRSPELSPTERETMTRLVARFRAGGKSWHPGARPALERLLLPLHAALDHIGAVNAIKHKYAARTTVVCLLVRAMHRENCSFWAFTTSIWHELLGRDYDAYARRHGAKANGRQHLVAVAYLLGEFNDLGALGRLAHHPLAAKVFGGDLIDAAVADVLADLRAWGYTQSGNTVAVRNALAEALLARRSPRLADLTLAGLAELHRVADAKITRRGLVLLSYVLTRRGLIPEPLGRAGQGELKERIEHRRAADGVPPAWRQWCERWFATSTLQQSSRISVLYHLFQAGRWLGQTHPALKEPADWTRETAADFVAAVDRSTVGQWSTPTGTIASRVGQPRSAGGKEAFLKALRTFFADGQDWGWIPRRFNPARALASPRSVRAALGPDPQVIADASWAKVVWAGLNLTDEDMSKGGDGIGSPWRFYPPAMIRALAVVWLFSGLRRDEIMRLRVGCIRWQESPAGAEGSADPGHKICLLDVPVNKTGTAFTKPVDGVVGEVVGAWEAVRPPQPPWTDPKTGERVQVLFSHRGRRIGLSYLNGSLIPLLCNKAGVPLDDARGRITSHRARATIASQLYNAKEPLSLFELQEWLGHRSPEATRHYTRISPTKLAKSYAAAGYFARNLRAVEVLIDQEVIRSGRAAVEPWKHYDLGHGYCTYDFFDQCPHRMACARCDFYLPKDSAEAQMLEGKDNLLRLRQEIPLNESELAAVEEGVAAYERLINKLRDVPTPAGATPRQMSVTIV